jgi:NAD-dependent dihydropyrimidine dehydrogenase PreA subunit
MVEENNVYVKLSEKIGVVGYPRYIEILKNEMTLEEAGLAVDLAEGKTPAELMKKLKIDEKTLAARTGDLAKRHFVRLTKDGKYFIPQMPRFFPRINDTPKLKELWFDFFHSGDYVEIDVAHMKARAQIRPEIRSHKIIPAHKALLASTNIAKNQILWYEDIEQIFKHSDTVSQGGFNRETGELEKRDGCGCRRYWGTCESPGGCTGWQWKQGVWGNAPRLPLPFGDKFVVTFEQAMDSNEKMEDFGLIKMSPNTAQIDSTCNCCECCCEIIHGFKKLANIWDLISPSRFRAVIDEEKCQGCQTCIDRCHFDAIEMKKVPGSKKMKAYMINEHCMGCGLCVFKCPGQAIRLEIVRPPSHIPVITVAELFGNAKM